MLNLGVASTILDSLKTYINFETLLTDQDGVIVSGPKERMGKVLSVAKDLLDGTADRKEVHSGDAYELGGTDSGFYVVLTVNQEKIGVLGVLGENEGLISTSSLVKVCVEKSLELERMNLDQAKGSESNIHQLIYTPHMSRDDLDYLVRIAHIRSDVARVPLLFVLHYDDGQRVPSGVVKKAILNSAYYTATDLLCSTLDNNVIWFKSIRNQDVTRFLANTDYMNEEILDILSVFDSFVYSVYVGAVQDKLNNYSRAYRQCEWMRLDICERGVYYLHNYILRYLSSKVSEHDYSTLFSAVLDVIDENTANNFCEIMEALIQCDYSFSKVAEKLHIHKNTALYRFDKIRNLFEINPLINNNERVYLEVLYSYMKSHPVQP